MRETEDLTLLPDTLLPWFYENKRDLPWRKDRQPYHIWLSEIMLQQTRVEAVKGFYTRFLNALPDIRSLANADDESLHKLWEGLGYYSRVRNLHKASKIIMDVYEGSFPDQYDQIRALPGIGDYTAGAICSIAYNQRTPAVDGNVLRVFSRLTDDDTPIDLPAMKRKAAEELRKIYPERAGDFTQALMELGATVCGPNRKPECEACPCKCFCLGYLRNTQDNLPVKSSKKQRREEDLTVFILCNDGRYALEKRPNKGLLAGLWQFPNMPGHLNTEQAIRFVEETGLSVKDISRQVERKHIFTHIQWNMRGYYLEVIGEGGNYQWFTPEQIKSATALPTAFRQFWDSLENQA